MRIHATSVEENEKVHTLAEQLRKEGKYVDVYNYEDSFGIACWSIADLENISETENWSLETKIAFFENSEKQLTSDMVERGWESLDTLVSMFDAPEDSEIEEDE